MGIKKTEKEIEVLLMADRELASKGKTDVKCPRCGNDFVYENYGTGHILKCETPECLTMTLRGI